MFTWHTELVYNSAKVQLQNSTRKEGILVTDTDSKRLSESQK